MQNMIQAMAHAPSIYRSPTPMKLPCADTSLRCAGVERTWNAKQTDIVAAVDSGAARKALDLRLTELGPYSVDFTRSGRYALLAGKWVAGLQMCWSTCSYMHMHVCMKGGLEFGNVVDTQHRPFACKKLTKE